MENEHKQKEDEVWLADWCVCVCVCVEGVGDVVLSNDASQVPARHADLSHDV